MKNERELQLFITTFNLGNAQPQSLESWIPPDGLIRPVLQEPSKYPNPSFGKTDAAKIIYSETDQFDLVVIGMQEATFDPPPEDLKDSSDHSDGSVFHLKVPVLDPLIRKGTKNVTKNVNKVSKNVTAITTLATSVDYTKKKTPIQKLSVLKSEWGGGTGALHTMMDAWLPSYTRKVSFQRGQMRLEVYAIASLEDQDIEVRHVAAQNTGRGGLANKGGIAATLFVKGTQISFLSAHLEAHEGKSKYQMRCSSIGDILGGTRYNSHDVSLTSHFTFFCGDLNFRTELPEEDHQGDEERHKRIVQEMVRNQDWKSLNDADELHRALEQKHCLADFQTPRCNFPPTFKVERKPGYIYIDKRRPSYTDRILWKANNGLSDKVLPLLYEPCDDFSSSDHKPVRAAFSVTLNETYKLRPRMTRTESAVRLSPAKNKKIQSKPGKAHERLHLFVSDIRCDITPIKESAPQTYICLQVTPEDVLRKKEGWMEHFRKRLKFGKFAGRAPKREGAKRKTRSGWPRSTSRKETWQPDWGEEDIHCVVKTHHSNGEPYDLTGAQLQIVVFSVATAGDDTPIGTFTFNLVDLLRGCNKLKHESARVLKQSIRVLDKNSNAEQRSSIIAGSDFDVASGAIDDVMTSAEIDEPLMKNGMEFGRLKCSVESWWMNEKTAKLVTRSPKNIMAHFRRESVLLQQIDEDGEPISHFSSRHMEKAF